MWNLEVIANCNSSDFVNFGKFSVRNDVCQIPWLLMLDLSQSFIHIRGLCNHYLCQLSHFYDVYFLKRGERGKNHHTIIVMSSMLLSEMLPRVQEVEWKSTSNLPILKKKKKKKNLPILCRLMVSALWKQLRWYLSQVTHLIYWGIDANKYLLLSHVCAISTSPCIVQFIYATGPGRCIKAAVTFDETKSVSG